MTFLTHLLILMFAFSCKPRTKEKTSVKSAVTIGPEGQTFVFYKRPPLGEIIVSRRCETLPIIDVPSDIERECPTNDSDRDWPIEDFKKAFKRVFYLEDTRATNRDSPYGDILDVEQEVGENALELRDQLAERISRLEILVGRHPGNGFEERLAEARTEFDKVGDLGTLVQRFNIFVDSLVDKIVNNVEVFPFEWAKEEERFIVVNLVRLAGSANYVCRGGYIGDKGRFVCGVAPTKKYAVIFGGSDCLDLNRHHYVCEYFDESDERATCYLGYDDASIEKAKKECESRPEE